MLKTILFVSFGMYYYLDNAQDDVDGEDGVGAFGIVEVAAVEEAR